MRVHYPSELKFEVFHAVQTHNLSRRVAARRFGISPTRVQQMVEDVKAFVAQHGGDSFAQAAPEQLEIATLRLCHERLTYFYRVVMRQYNTLVAQAPGSAGAVRLLMAAAKMSLEQAKLAGRIAKVQLEMIEAGTLSAEPREFVYADDDQDDAQDAEQCQSEAASQPQPAQAISQPPARGCTVDDDGMTAEEEQALREVLASLGPQATSEEILAELMRRGQKFLFARTPAQLAAG